MTLVEFYDKTATENICSCLIKAPERVVLIGDKMKLLKRQAECYAALMRDRGHTVEFVCRSVNRNDLDAIVAVLSETVEKYDDCVFDLTGGEDLFLVATGVVAERFRERHLQLHRFNINTGRICDCDSDGTTIMESEHPAVSFAEQVKLYGGELVYDKRKKDATPVWSMTPEFVEDINAIWDVCRARTWQWNTQINVFAAALEVSRAPADSAFIEASVAETVAKLKEENPKWGFKLSREILIPLYERGLITDWSSEGDDFRISFKNRDVMRCLTKAGQALEMKIYSTALAARADGVRFYDDAVNGAFIDWDGEVHPDGDGSFDTENEIDVALMKGLIPVFVSCKNGWIEMEELYKLDSVAQKFGRKYSRRVLVATGLDDGSFAGYFRQRARDMGIKLVEGVQHMTDEELEREVIGFIGS